MPDRRIVKALDDLPGRPMDCVYDASTGRYLEPINLPSRPLKLRLLGWTMGMFSQSKAAILDTGMLANHPRLRKRIIGSVDFTGEGPEDLNGHGTAVALVLLASSFVPTKLLNVKVLDRDKVGTKEDLIAGMRWAEKFGVDVINLSLGILQNCDGTCDVCQEASRIARTGVLICAAAGNEGPTCPARADGVIAVGGSPTVIFAPINR